MKKTFFGIMFAMVFAMVLGSCGNSTSAGTSVDSLGVDTVDTLTGDTIAVDSTVCAD